MKGFIKAFIDRFTQSIFFEAVVNVTLVYYNERDAFLYESTNFKNNTQFIYKLVEMFNNNGAKFKIKNDEYTFPRFLVYKEDSWIDKDLEKNPDNIRDDSSLAKYLGFQCVGHDFSNYWESRITVSFFVENPKYNKRANIVTEVCEINKIPKNEIERIAFEKLERFNSVLKQYDLKVTVDITVDQGVNSRIKKVDEKNIVYIRDNIDDYTNDIENEYGNFDKTYTYQYLEKNNYKIDYKFIDFLKFFYNYMVDGVFDDFHAKFDINYATDLSIQLDKCIWENIEQNTKEDIDKCKQNLTNQS
jgi:hypothetical protein